MSRKISLFFVLASALFVAAGCTFTLGGSDSQKIDGGVWKSADGGQTWTQTVAVPLTGGKVASIADVDVNKIVFDPQDHNTIYLATESDGIVYTYNGGISWQKFSALNTGKIRGIAVDPVFKCTLYVITGNKLYKSNDCGRFWDNVYFHQNSDVALTSIAVDHANKDIVYMGTSDGEVLKSADGGTTWKTANYVKGGIIMDVIIDPNNHSIVYAATDDRGIYKSTDGGANWVSLSDRVKGFSGASKYIKMVADKATSGGLIHISKYGMLRSIDGGETWTAVELLPAPKNTSIYALAVNPKNSNEIYYSTTSSLVKSIDGGKSWSSQKLPFARLANSIAIDFQDTNIVYLGAFKAKN
jgi:photosystem II stability/assembly factor-like uncharacterized protein